MDRFRTRLCACLMAIIALGSCAPGPSTLPEPKWPPSGRIAFYSTYREPAGIYVINADGSDVTLIGEVPLAEPVWAPDGSRIAVSYTQGDSRMIGVFRLDGSRLPADLTILSPGDEPAWSPDSSRIAFVGGPTVNGDIYIMRADGSHLIQLTDDPRAEYSPAWSPDGSRIAYATSLSKEGLDAHSEEASSINVIESDGGRPLEVASFTGSTTGPVWAPDGKKIAYLRWHGLQVVALDGDRQAELGRSGAATSKPSWSPDGSYLVYPCSEGDKSWYGSRLTKICSVKSDGSERVRVLTSKFSGNEHRAVWSPDENWIAFNNDFSDALWIMTANGTRATNLVGAHYAFFAWAP